MEKVTRLPLDPERNVERRRLHLREINDDAQEPQGSVGDALRATRLRLDEDLRTVAAVLRIRPEHLEALEEGAHEKLPGRTYALGFLRSYADYLGLDADEAVARFKEETAASEDDKPSELVFPDAQEEVRIPQGSILIVGGLLLLGVWGGYYLSQSAHRLLSEDEPQPVRTTEATTASSQASPATAPTPTSGAATSAPAATAAPATSEAVAPAVDNAPRVFGVDDPAARVTLKALRDVWIRIDDTAAGAMLHTLDLRAGDIYRVPNKPDLILSTRDAGGIEINLDGQALGPAGASGQALDSFSLDPEKLAGAATRGPRP